MFQQCNAVQVVGNHAGTFIIVTIFLLVAIVVWVLLMVSVTSLFFGKASYLNTDFL
jgi:uncharacterized membrane protein